MEARKLLSKNKIDVKKFENKEESLIIMDAGRAYFGSSMDIISFIESLSNLVAETGKNGLSIFADIGPLPQTKSPEKIRIFIIFILQNQN